MRKFAFVGCAFVLSLQLATRDADATLTPFFGEDPKGTPLTTHPNADMARASFLDELSNPGTEDFEGFLEPEDRTAPLSITFLDAGGMGIEITATLTGPGEVKEVESGDVGPGGRYAISEDQFWESADSFVVEFSDPVAAFGFYGVDIGDFGGQVILTLTLEGDVVGVVEPIGTIGAPDGGVLYFGLIAETFKFDAITFDNTSSDNQPPLFKDFFAFDDMTVGSLKPVEPPKVIPEPASLALFGLGLGGVGFMRRRKKAIA